MTYLCPDSTFAQLPSSALQTDTVLSALADASSLPSGLQATANTSRLPFSVTYATVSYAHAPDRPVAVVSARHTSNGLSILPLLVPFTANTCRG